MSIATDIVSTIAPEVQRKFHKNAHWALAGSIMYETCKVAHCFLLLQVMSPALFGTVGSLLAMLYFASYVADLGATNSIPPFLHVFTQSKKTFRTFIVRYALLPNIPFIIICAVVTSFVIQHRFTMVPAFGLIGVLVFLEAIRSFLRFFLHVTFQARYVVIVELFLFVGVYLGGIWIPLLITFYATGAFVVTPNLIFVPHLIDSLLAVIIFVAFTYRYYQRLPRDRDGVFVFPPGMGRRVVTTRLFNYVLRVGRNLFTGNFLTPIFAVRFGLAAAGLFYFASVTVSALQAIVKAIVGYSGNALLAEVKNAGQSVKKEAFEVLCQKFVTAVFPIFIFFGVNFRALLRLANKEEVATYTLSVLFLYLVISFADFFFVLYEQFYVIEEAADKLCLFKLLECVVFYGFISSSTFSSFSSPIALLVGLIVTRCITLFIIVTDAYYRWGVIPRLKRRLGYLGWWLLISSIVAASLLVLPI
jgi:hypothetical protein